ncbi:MAG: DNA adenine methylase, partial [Myxococcota bacterium]
TSGFTDQHQGKLYEVAKTLDRRGCMVMLSNTSTPLVRRLYRGWDIKEANRGKTRRRGVRGKPVELVIRNYA